MKYRAEIDGLRALAVLPVIFFHAGFELFNGGFIGVDVFFVISGYLITTIIITEMAEGKFSIINFYERRARRILPALFFVMAACIPFAWIILTPPDLKDFGESIIAVSTFSSNILFWFESGYFDTQAELKPLLHTWSLAVEEQYYILFPIFILLTWRLGIHWVVIFLAIIFLISLCLAQWGAFKMPAANFYLLPTRGWEIIIGVFAAFLIKYDKRIESFVLNQILSLIGFVMIIYSIFAFDKTTPFPSFYTLIPTVGTGLLILCAVPRTFIHDLLTKKLFVGLGLTSYSIYLWHQPLLVFAKYVLLMNDLSYLIAIAICIISIVMAWISWKFIERPFRDKKVYNRKDIFLFSIVGIIFFSGLGSVVINNDGFKVFKYEAINKNLKRIGIDDFQSDNQKLRIESWNILRKISGDPNYYVDNNIFDQSYFSNSNKKKKRMLIVGNSHSKDLFNVFYHSSDIQENFDVSRYGIQLKNIDTNFYKTISYEKSDIVIIATKYTKYDLENLYEIAVNITKDGKKLFIVEEIFNFPSVGKTALADLIIKRTINDQNITLNMLKDRINEAYTQYFLSNSSTKKFLESKKQFDILRKKIEKDIPQVHFLNRMDYVCPNKYCLALDNNGRKNFFDYGHHTMSGASFFGTKLKETNFYKELIKGINS